MKPPTALMALSIGYGLPPVTRCVRCSWLLRAVSAELEQLLGHDFNGILSSDCFSAYSPQSAAAKQKCLAHLERDLEALKTSRFEGNRQLQERVEQVLWAARQAHRDYHAGKLSLEQLQQQRPVLESQLQGVLDHPPVGGWPFPLPKDWPTASNAIGMSGSHF